jgi:hypothetical protein
MSAKTTTRATMRRVCLSVVGALGLAVLSPGCTGGVDTGLLDSFLGTFGEPVTVPQADRSPPQASLIFNHPRTGKRTVVKPGDAPLSVSLKTTDRFFVIAAADDPQGVKDIRVIGSMEKRCTSERVGMKQSGSLFLSFPDNGGPGDTALTRRWLPFLIDGAQAQSCPSGYTLFSYVVSIHGVGENFHGGTSTTPTVTFSVSP